MHLTGKLGVLAAWPFLLHGLQSPARMDWIRVSAPNLELLTTGEACVAAEAVADLESLRLYFRSKVPLKTMAEPSLRIVAFSSEREYQPFRLNARSPAYFAGGPGQATIVLGRLAEDQFPSLRHEFVHFLFRANRWQPPLWLEEGLAEFLGGVDRVTAQSRTTRLRRTGFQSISDLGGVSRNSATTLDREAALRFYARSWAAVHLLMTSPVYRDGAWAFIGQVSSGSSVEDALRATYGRGLVEFEAGLSTHLDDLGPANVAPGREEPRLTVDAAGMADVELALSRLELAIGRYGAAQQRIDALLAVSRTNPEVWSVAGELALKDGRTVEARFALQQAMTLGSRDARGLKQLAALESAAMNRAALEPVLSRLVEVDPRDEESRQALSSLHAPR